jgi:beta-glucosidase
LLKNDGVLPLSSAIRKVAVLGPLADLPVEQVGCWVMDGVAHAVQTPLAALRASLGAENVTYCPALPGVRSTDTSLFPEALAAARAADVVILMLGEDAGLSGEAHCRAFLDLPGAQADLVAQVAAVGKPVVAVVMAGRPLLLGGVQDQLNALLWAWHPGTMGGPAIVDLLFGQATPGGRLPVTFPRTVGQIPTYYNRKNTGRPPYEGEWGAPMGTPLDPKDFTSRYMDVDFKPLYPFGFGLSYTTFEFSPVILSAASMTVGGKVTVSATVTNTGTRSGITVPQLYLHDVTGSATRPVRELKGFQKIELAAGESRVVSFELGTDDLAYWNGQMKFAAEPGTFRFWIAADSDCKPHEPAVFELVAAQV